MSRRFRIVWTEVAADDYESILVYVARQSGVVRARQLNEKMSAKISALETSPSSCRAVPELRREGLTAYRELIVRPYRVMFRIRGQEVVLLAVVDGRRDLHELLWQRALAE